MSKRQQLLRVVWVNRCNSCGYRETVDKLQYKCGSCSRPSLACNACTNSDERTRDGRCYGCDDGSIFVESQPGSNTIDAVPR